jgi:membrane-associated phospholipid phosphatase
MDPSMNTVEEVLVNEIPIVLRADLYAVAALAGAGVVVAGHLLHWPRAVTTVAGAILCFGAPRGNSPRLAFPSGHSVGLTRDEPPRMRSYTSGFVQLPVKTPK